MLPIRPGNICALLRSFEKGPEISKTVKMFSNIFIGERYRDARDAK